MRQAPAHPGEVFRLDYRQAGTDEEISQAECARRMGIPVNRLNELERGKRGITPKSAILIGALTGTSAELWMNLQARHDLWHAMQEMGTPNVKSIA